MHYCIWMSAFLGDRNGSGTAQGTLFFWMSQAVNRVHLHPRSGLQGRKVHRQRPEAAPHSRSYLIASPGMPLGHSSSWPPLLLLLLFLPLTAASQARPSLLAVASQAPPVLLAVASQARPSPLATASQARPSSLAPASEARAGLLAATPPSNSPSSLLQRSRLTIY
jgi:hypothetical protein